MKSVESKIKRVVFSRLFEDEDLLTTITSTAKQNNVNSGFFFLIGTLKKTVLGYYKEGKYEPIEKDGPLEIVSCMGNISVKDKAELVVHGHIVVSDNKGDAFGGHILPGCLVGATAELVLVEVESGALKREFDARRNLYLWFLEK
ncbi:MAG: DNA-binding protein [Candidatus Bathyarchaeota archaeon]|nr:DNA-binding protein [Candidatus Bathyarchaeota archaeon]MDH5495089.1 DNA-binding protein [Candidatus Bathyarchaeota archaeon]